MSVWKAMGGQVRPTVNRTMRIDASTGALMVIDYAHHEIHEGSDFTYDDVITLGSGATQNYVLTVPDTGKWAHFGYEIDGIFGVTVELYEGSDRTPTTLQASFNRNRNSSKTATMTVHKGYSGGTTDGTRIMWRKAGSGTTSGKLAGKAGDDTERVLKQNTQYTLRITSAAASNDINVKLGWYEHTDRD